MNNPEKKERKRRIKDQNTKRARRPKTPVNPEPMTREEFDRTMEGLAMIAFGLMRVANIDLRELIGEEFPSELDVK